MRISTVDKQTFDRQEKQLLDAGCTYLYQDKISGSKRHRPDLDRMLEEVEAGDRIIITELARLSRSTIDLLNLVKLLKAKGVLLTSLHDTWLDLSENNPMSNFMLTMLAGLAELEREQITERVRQGVAVAKEKGIKFGRPTVKRSKVAHALELYDNGGHTAQEIAEICNISRKTLYNKLKARKEGTLKL